jgi:hypothetical protein
MWRVCETKEIFWKKHVAGVESIEIPVTYICLEAAQSALRALAASGKTGYIKHLPTGRTLCDLYPRIEIEPNELPF